MSGGRFVLGLGASTPQLAEGLHDTPFEPPVPRMRRMVTQIRALLRGERTRPVPPSRCCSSARTSHRRSARWRSRPSARATVRLPMPDVTPRDQAWTPVVGSGECHAGRFRWAPSPRCSSSGSTWPGRARSR
ncbi:MAG TPA: hypothetical protein VFV05_11290 [Methylomirabilota bacterium]|nr:hypothetical protein [Methylomirabilota bacterium]